MNNLLKSVEKRFSSKFNILDVDDGVDDVVSMYKSFKTFKGNVESSVKAFDISKPGY